MKKIITIIDSCFNKEKPFEEIRTIINSEFDREILQKVMEYYLNKNECHNKVNFIYEYLVEDLEIEDKKLIIRWYLTRSDHFDHEDAVDYFQYGLYNKENLPFLVEAIDNIPNYLSHNDMKYPYIRKIIYVIGAQPEPYNIETLMKLSEDTNDNKIKELVLHQIKKRNELGRFESKL